MGTVSPCCAYTGHFAHINDIHDLQEHWANGEKWKSLRADELTGVWHLPGCQNCEKVTDVTARRKERFNNFAQGNASLNCQTVELKHLDIAFSNACNLTCVMCKSDFSTSWYKADADFAVQHPWRERFKPWSMSLDKIDRLATWIPSGLSVEIKGGEPLIDMKVIYFLEKLRDLGKKIDLHLVTNFTLVDDEKVSLLVEHLKSGINVSVDGYGRTYEWMRGFSFAKLEENLITYLPKICDGNRYCIFNYVSTAFNIISIDEFWIWIESMMLRTGVRILPDFNFIAATPGYVSPALTPDPLAAMKSIDRTIQLVTETKSYAGQNAEATRARIVRELKAVKEFIRKNHPLQDEETVRRSNLWRLHVAKLRGWDIFSPASDLANPTAPAL